MPQIKVDAAKGIDAYDIRTSKKVFNIATPNGVLTLRKGEDFGIRPASNGGMVRIVFPSKPGKVFSLSVEMGEKVYKASTPSAGAGTGTAPPSSKKDIKGRHWFRYKGRPYAFVSMEGVQMLIATSELFCVFRSSDGQGIRFRSEKTRRIVSLPQNVANYLAKNSVPEAMGAAAPDGSLARGTKLSAIPPVGPLRAFVSWLPAPAAMEDLAELMGTLDPAKLTIPKLDSLVQKKFSVSCGSWVYVATTHSESALADIQLAYDFVTIVQRALGYNNMSVKLFMSDITKNAHLMALAGYIACGDRESIRLSPALKEPYLSLIPKDILTRIKKIAR